MPSQFKSLEELNAEFVKKKNERIKSAYENQESKSDVVKENETQEEVVPSQKLISQVIDEKQVTKELIENIQQTSEEVLEENVQEQTKETVDESVEDLQQTAEEAFKENVQEQTEETVDESAEDLQQTAEEAFEENVQEQTEETVDESAEDLQQTAEEVLQENVQEPTEETLDEIVEDLQQTAEEVLQENVQELDNEKSVDEDIQGSIHTQQKNYDDEVSKKLQGVVFESEEDKENDKQSLNKENIEQPLSFETILKTLQDAEKRLGMVDTYDDKQIEQQNQQHTKNKTDHDLLENEQEQLNNAPKNDETYSSELQVKKEVDLKTEIISDKAKKKEVSDKFKNIIRILINIVFYFIIIFIIIGAIIIAVGSDGPGSSLFGYKFYQVNTTSMSPEYIPGDLLIVKETNVNIIKENDVITYNPNKNSPEYLTHRVVEKIENYEETGYPAFKTKGDANLSNDSYIVEHNQVIGVVQYKVPLMGRFARIILDNTLLVIIILVLLIALCILVRALFGIKYKPRFIKITFVQKNN